MLLLISDANILMDVEVGDLVAPMFSLGYQFAVPDILFYEELEGQHAHLLEMGLQVRTLVAEGVERVQALAQIHPKPGRNDLFALALAETEKCPLLTGDAALRQAAESEQVEVKGTIWLIGEMLREGRITVAVARAGLHKMRANGRRLPWDVAEQMLATLEAMPPDMKARNSMADTEMATKSGKGETLRVDADVQNRTSSADRPKAGAKRTGGTQDQSQLK